MQTLQEVMHSNVDNMSYCDKRSMKMDISLSKKKNILNAGGNRENTLSEGEENGKKYNRVFARIFEITSIVTEIKKYITRIINAKIVSNFRWLFRDRADFIGYVLWFDLLIRYIIILIIL